MNRELAEKVAKAVLYEGYMLYPYRMSAIKNRQRWTFGILYPPAYHEVVHRTERNVMHSECLLQSDGQAAITINVDLRFLHLVARQVMQEVDGNHKPVASLMAGGRLIESWDEGIERSVDVSLKIPGPAQQVSFDFPGRVETETLEKVEESQRAAISRIQHGLTGSLTVAVANISDGFLKLTVDVSNTTTNGDVQERDQALLRSMLSAHAILTASGGDFVSLLDPPAELREAVSSCHNVGNFPVLVGNEGERDMMLCSPIVLYDYPQIAPESTGDFFDSTEMDEMLTLRVMNLTDEEKDQMRFGEEHVRALLQRTEESARDQLMKTHGVIRSMRPVSENS